MTKMREPATIEDAIQRAIGYLLKDGVEAATGKSARLVRAWSDPDDDERRIPLHQAVALDRACIEAGQEPPILEAYRALALQATAPAHSPADPRDRLARIMAEVGDVAGEVRAGLSENGPGGTRLTVGERVRIAAEAQEAVDALRLLIKDMESSS